MARSDQTLSCGLPLTSLPVKTTDSTAADVPLRLNGYGELATRSAAQYDLAEEGALFVATNPTISTGMTWVAAQTAFSDTAPNFHIRNAATAGGKSVRLHSLKMIATAAATSATAIHYAVIMDVVLRAIGTNNTAAIVPVNVNGNVGNSLDVLVNVQNSATVSAITASSASKRIVARGCLGGLNIAGEEMQICFGDPIGGSSVFTAVSAAGQPGRRSTAAPAVVIPPQGTATIHIWMPASSASFDPEFELIFSVK